MLDIYDKNEDNTQRYSLGTKGSKTLYVFGINPSTATDLTLDHTLTNVKKFSEILGFNSFVMFNLYPQRSTNPDGLHKIIDMNIHERNLKFIEKRLSQNPTIWAAWGETVLVRPYFADIIKDLHLTTKALKPKWIQYGDLTKTGHPRHPSRKKHVDNFKAFSFEAYLKHIDESL